MSGKKGMQPYPREVKIRAVKMFIEEGKTQKEVLEALGIKNDSQLENWCSQYRKGGYECLGYKMPGRPKKSSKKDQTPAQRINQLEMENELLRNFLLETERWLIGK